ncbi:hypothetical protein K402DRAFT_325512 [Aulographum hederae CBS 113979]|uniref:Methyltransferase domain-containing protein n=1 Tax=Aulographum hederae CBS 113979 TaxID=1176131 RepID=A0A6G1H9V5_9PEZI|nr:hypothetical protein K402DRAFT_325512 [Aulographum hederae CBS 113979]
MGPEPPIPLSQKFSDADVYVESLLDFATTSELLQTLCGGIHVLDFFTRVPDLYSTVLPQDWRLWFRDQDVMDILDLLMREELDHFGPAAQSDDAEDTDNPNSKWRSGLAPPLSLVDYIQSVRAHSLSHSYKPPKRSPSLARHVAVGMKVKKVHEVSHLASYVNNLTSSIEAATLRKITHLVDFGSGQNYLGRALASEPYFHKIVAIENRPHVVDGARKLDVFAKLTEKPMVMRNKKAYRAELLEQGVKITGRKSRIKDFSSSTTLSTATSGVDSPPFTEESFQPRTRNSHESHDESNDQGARPGDIHTTEKQNNIRYIEHQISDGNLEPVVSQIIASDFADLENPVRSFEKKTSGTNDLPSNPSLLVLSLHSCGNLSHHGLRTITSNPAVAAVALVGCCYNLLTERLGPPTYKLPSLKPYSAANLSHLLRSAHPRLVEASSAFDPHGFPMSRRFETYTPRSNSYTPSSPPQPGIRLNITARMMAVQAPWNWTPEDSSLFFTRHFFRALLQRIFFEKGVIGSPSDMQDTNDDDRKDQEGDTVAPPIILGSLPKSAYADFKSYVRAALHKLSSDSTWGPAIRSAGLHEISDAEIVSFETRFGKRKKDLSVMWSLMAFSAGVVESLIVVDRWLWLKEQPEVGQAWVETVFDEGMSPRNFCVVGVRKTD